MSDTLPITEARAHFGSLVRRASASRERTIVTDHGQPAAVIINADELASLEAGLEDALAIVEHRARVADGTARFVPHAEVAAQHGLTPDGRPL